MTQDDTAIVDRLKHESFVRWTRASGIRQWQPCDVRSEVMLNAARHIEAMAKQIAQLKSALDMMEHVQIDCGVLQETNKRLELQLAEARK